MSKKAKKAKRATAAPKPKATALYGVVHELASLKAVLSNVLAAVNNMNDSLVRQRTDIDMVYVGQKILGDRLDAVRTALEAARVDSGTVFKALESVRLGQSALDDAIATFVANQPAWDNDLLRGLQEMVAEHRRTRREG